MANQPDFASDLVFRLTDHDGVLAGGVSGRFLDAPIKEQEFRGRRASLVPVGPPIGLGLQAGLIIVDHLTQLLVHQLFENEVDQVGNLVAGAVIVAQVQGLAALPIRAELIVVVLKQGGVGLAEAVDRLLHVPNHKAVVLPTLVQEA